MKKMDANKTKILSIFEKGYGSPAAAQTWFQRWRIFYLSVAELFNYNQGQEWVKRLYFIETPLIFTGRSSLLTKEKTIVNIVKRNIR